MSEPRRRTFLKILGYTAGGFTLVGLFGQKLFAVPRYDGTVSDHFNGEKFFNPHSRDAKGFGDFLRWTFNREEGPWQEWTENKAFPTPPERVGQGKIRVTFINHSSTLIQVDGLNFLTDPVYSERVSPVKFAGPKRHRAPGIKFRDLPPIDYILLSHNHYDHCDLDTLNALKKKFNPKIYTTLGNKSFLNDEGFPDVEELDWWGSWQIKNGTKLSVMPAQHFSGRGLSDRNNALWCGFMIESSAGQIYFAGDSGYTPQFKEIGEKFPDIRIALIPIGAYKPRWFMAPVHMGPKEAIQCAQDVRAKEVIGIHYGTFKLADDGQFEPIEDLRKHLESGGFPGAKFHTPDNGESWEI